MIATLLASAEFKVGLLVLIASGLIATMAIKSSENPAYLGGSKEAYFMMDDASGLVKNSAVKMAGIDVGIIKDIRLQNGQARVDMVIKADTPVSKSARIEIRPNGILGDKHVEIVSGDPRDPPLRSGEQILIVDDRASMDKLMQEVGRITKNLSTVAENLKDATEGDTSKPLGKILANIQQLSGDIAELSREHKGEIGDIIANLHEITDSVNDIVGEDGPEGLKAKIKVALDRLDSSMKNVDEITGKINRGEGTIGKLVNDESTAEKLDTAIDGVNGFLDTANTMQTSIDFHSDYIMRDHDAKSFLSVNLQPGLDRYYELGVVSDPHGVVERTNTTDTGTAGSIQTNETKTYLDRIKINALFAKNFYDFTLKGGIMENTGGVGFDYFFFKRQLRLSIEAYDFATFHLRTFARYSLFKGIYLTGGGDDLTSKTSASAFVGAGIFITNDDLKLLLTKVPGM